MTTYQELLASHRGKWFDVSEGAGLPVQVVGPYDDESGRRWRLAEVGVDFVEFDGGDRGGKHIQLSRITLCSPPTGSPSAGSPSAGSPGEAEEGEIVVDGAQDLVTTGEIDAVPIGRKGAAPGDVGERLGRLALSALSAIDALVTAIGPTDAAGRGGGGDGRGRSGFGRGDGSGKRQGGDRGGGGRGGG
ncbi:MAG: hypothetical protein DRI90_10110, partial [Deltaproteobacteria bacterium]